MFKQKKIIIALTFLFFAIIEVKEAEAVMPPDFIVNIGSQITQIFSLVVLFASAVFGVSYRFLKFKFIGIEKNRWTRRVFFAFLIIIGLIGLWEVSVWYVDYKTKKDFEDWKIESSRHDSEFQSTLLKEEKKNEEKPIDDSQARVSQNNISNVDDNYFISMDKDERFVVSNEDFQRTLDQNKDDLFVLDAREDIEYKNGKFPGSVHIRFADIRAGRWVEIPTDKKVYVICWSGIRGKEVAVFLREKGIQAFYLEDGAGKWVESGGKWEGEILLSSIYSAEKYRRLLSTSDFRRYMKNGVVVVDSRESARFDKWHVPGSFNIPILYTTSADIDKVFGQIPLGSKVVVVCDTYVNCFDARITGIELDSRGYILIGRYNKPWEYRDGD